MTRASGVLLHISSLPGDYGIGTLGEEARAFIDALAAAKQRYWQILPFGPTGYGDSPYQSFSCFATNPYFIDLHLLCREGLLSEEECGEVFWGGDPERVDYGAVYNGREPLLRRAYQRAEKGANFEKFCAENADWLEDYALFMAIKRSLGGAAFSTWPEELRIREPKALAEAKERLADDLRFYSFCQYLSEKQWLDLHEYAAGRGVKIIGDMPIYVSEDGADLWSRPELFRLDENRRPTHVAGCPPDYFSATGQLWGNPLYHWERHAADGFAWWRSRIRRALRLCDIVRIDHFRGLADYWAISYGEETAVNGKWELGPGHAFTDAISREFGAGKIIAEDLGILSDAANELREYSGFPGMQVLQFAFSASEESNYLPHNHIKNSVVYTGTHDNDTTQGVLRQMNITDIHLVCDYLGIEGRDPRAEDMIRAALTSVADTAILPAQDLLGLDSWARMNTPGTSGSNWVWRMKRGDLREGCPAFEKLKRMTEITGRARLWERV